MARTSEGAFRIYFITASDDQVVDVKDLERKVSAACDDKGRILFIQVDHYANNLGVNLPYGPQFADKQPLGIISDYFDAVDILELPLLLEPNHLETTDESDECPGFYVERDVHDRVIGFSIHGASEKLCKALKK